MRHSFAFSAVLPLGLALGLASGLAACVVNPPPQNPGQPYPGGQGGSLPPQSAPVTQVGPSGDLQPYNGEIACNGTEDLVIENADIRLQGPAVMVNGACTITIRNSRIVSSGGPALLVSGSGDINVSYSHIVGNPPLIVSGSGDINAEASQIEGDLFVSGSGDISLRGNVIRGRSSVTGSGDIHDNGNQWQ